MEEQTVKELLNPDYNSIGSQAAIVEENLGSVARLPGFKPIAWKQMFYKFQRWGESNVP